MKHRKLTCIIGYDPHCGHRLGINAASYSHTNNNNDTSSTTTIITAGRDGIVRTWQPPPLAPSSQQGAAAAPHRQRGQGNRNEAPSLSSGINLECALETPNPKSAAAAVDGRSPVFAKTPQREEDDATIPRRPPAGSSPAQSSSPLLPPFQYHQHQHDVYEASNCASFSEVHSDAVTDIAHHPFEEGIFASCSADHSIVLHKEDERISSAAHCDTVKRLAWCGDSGGRYLSSISYDGTVMLHGVKNDELRAVARFNCASPLFGLALHDANTAIVGDVSGQLFAIDFRVKMQAKDVVTPIARNAHKGAVRDILCLPQVNQAIFASASADSTIKLWDLRTMKHVLELCIHSDAVWALSVYEPQPTTASSAPSTLHPHQQQHHQQHPSGPLLLSGGRDGIMRATSLRSLTSQATIHCDYPINHILVTPNDEHVYLSTASSSLLGYSLPELLTTSAMAQQQHGIGVKSGGASPPPPPPLPLLSSAQRGAGVDAVVTPSRIEIDIASSEGGGASIARDAAVLQAESAKRHQRQQQDGCTVSSSHCPAAPATRLVQLDGKHFTLPAKELSGQHRSLHQPPQPLTLKKKQELEQQQQHQQLLQQQQAENVAEEVTPVFASPDGVKLHTGNFGDAAAVAAAAAAPEHQQNPFPASWWCSSMSRSGTTTTTTTMTTSTASSGGGTFFTPPRPTSLGEETTTTTTTTPNAVLVPSRVPATPPSVVFHGVVGVVECALLDDKRHVVCRHDDKSFSLWSILESRRLRGFPGLDVADMDDFLRRVEVNTYCASWCVVEARWGYLCVSLSHDEAFNAMVSAWDIEHTHPTILPSPVLPLPSSLLFSSSGGAIARSNSLSCNSTSGIELLVGGGTEQQQQQRQVSESAGVAATGDIVVMDEEAQLTSIQKLPRSQRDALRSKPQLNLGEVMIRKIFEVTAGGSSFFSSSQTSSSLEGKEAAVHPEAEAAAAVSNNEQTPKPHHRSTANDSDPRNTSPSASGSSPSSSAHGAPVVAVWVPPSASSRKTGITEALHPFVSSTATSELGKSSRAALNAGGVRCVQRHKVRHLFTSNDETRVPYWIQTILKSDKVSSNMKSASSAQRLSVDCVPLIQFPGSKIKVHELSVGKSVWMGAICKEICSQLKLVLPRTKLVNDLLRESKSGVYKHLAISTDNTPEDDDTRVYCEELIQLYSYDKKTVIDPMMQAQTAYILYREKGAGVLKVYFNVLPGVEKLLMPS